MTRANITVPPGCRLKFLLLALIVASRREVLFIILFCKAWFHSGSIVFSVFPWSLEVTRKRKGGPMEPSVKIKKQKLPPGMSWAQFSALQRKRCYHSYHRLLCFYKNLLHHAALLRLGETAVVPPEATAIVQTSKMELNTHCSKIVRRVMEKTVALAKGLAKGHWNSTKIHQAMPTGKGESSLFAHRIIRIAQIRGGIVLCWRRLF